MSLRYQVPMRGETPTVAILMHLKLSRGQAGAFARILDDTPRCGVSATFLTERIMRALDTAYREGYNTARSSLLSEWIKPLPQPPAQGIL